MAVTRFPASIFLVFPMKNVALNETEKHTQKTKKERKKMPPFFAAARRNQKAKGKTHEQQKENAEKSLILLITAE